MKKSDSLILLVLCICLISCTNNINPLNTLNYEDSILQSKEFIQSYELIPESCNLILKSKIQDFYIDREKDSLSGIYRFEGVLFPRHYTKTESDNIEKYTFFIYLDDTIKNLYFGINRRTSDILFLNELDINDNQRVLTKEEHVAYTADLTELEGYGCVHFAKGAEKGDEIMRSISTFENNENKIWVVDSIQGTNIERSIFNNIDTFKIKKNRFIEAREKNIEFHFTGFQMIFVHNDDTINGRFISYSDNFRIIQEETEILRFWVYLKRL